MDDHEQPSYKIIVKRLDGRLFTYTTDHYEEIGQYIEFIDERTQETIRAPILNTEIRVVA